MKRHDDMSHQMGAYLHNMQLFHDACDTSISKISSMPISITTSQLPPSLSNNITPSTSSTKEEEVATTTTTTTTATTTTTTTEEKSENKTLTPPKVETQGSEEFVSVPLTSSNTPTNVE